jgi:PIN domain nuclease of toxin-antitoxin system
MLDDPQLSAPALAAIQAGQNADSAYRVVISPASYWEIAVKISMGKYALAAAIPYEPFWRSGIADNGFDILPVDVRHTAVLLDLPFHHKDPFDRLLIAQAISEDIPLVSADASFDRYPIKRIW